MEWGRLRELRHAALTALIQVGLGFENNVVVAYDTGGGWKVRAAPQGDMVINVREDRIQIAFSSFEDEIEIRDFILPLLETETYREKLDEKRGC